MSGDEQQLKLCLKCNTVKPLIEGFYKCGATYQKYCKPCHNKRRMEYKPSNSKYIKKPVGFEKLPKEIKDKIVYDMSVMINFKEIVKRHQHEYNKLNHQSLLKWNREGQIEKYKLNSNNSTKL